MKVNKIDLGKKLENMIFQLGYILSSKKACKYKKK